MKACNDVSNNQKLRILDVPGPCSPGPAPSSRKGHAPPPYTSEKASNDNALSTLINGWFVTAARKFQRGEGCAVLLPNAIGRGKERVPGPSRSLQMWPCPLNGGYSVQNSLFTAKLVRSRRALGVFVVRLKINRKWPRKRPKTGFETRTQDYSFEKPT